VTTDVLESGNGIWKKIMERSPSKESTHLNLLIPLIFGKWGVKEISKIIKDRPKIKEVKEWYQDNLPVTQRKLKRNPPSSDTKIDDFRQTFMPNSSRSSLSKGFQNPMQI
jgi:hypothetical protein